MNLTSLLNPSRRGLSSGLVGLLWLTSGMTPAALAADETAPIREALGRMAPGLEISAIEATPVPGLYAVLAGPQLVYMSQDGRYMLQGTLIDVDQRRNLSEPRLSKARVDAVEDVGEGRMVIFSPDEPTHKVTVFTDIDCGYCRKLHSEMEDYNKLGIAVRYLFFPRAGTGSPSYQKAVSVWCADDRQAAMTDAKAGKALEAKSCDNPVQDHMVLGEVLGVRGTPAIVTESGNLLPGYLPAAKLMARLKMGQ